VTFDGAASSDPDGDDLTYSWDFGDGYAVSDGATTVHEYTTNGVYTAALQVTDAGGASASTTVRIEVGNSPPQPAIQRPGADDLFAVGDTIVLQGSATDPEDGTLADPSLTWRVILHHNTAAVRRSIRRGAITGRSLRARSTITRVSVDGCTLRVEAVRIDGAVFDQFAIDRCTPAP